jgi:hypothetical protein
MSRTVGSTVRLPTTSHSPANIAVIPSLSNTHVPYMMSFASSKCRSCWGESPFRLWQQSLFPSRSRPPTPSDQLSCRVLMICMWELRVSMMTCSRSTKQSSKATLSSGCEICSKVCVSLLLSMALAASHLIRCNFTLIGAWIHHKCFMEMQIIQLK